MTADDPRLDDAGHAPFGPGLWTGVPGPLSVPVDEYAAIRGDAAPSLHLGWTSLTPEVKRDLEERFREAVANPGPLVVLPSDGWKARAEQAEAELEHAKSAAAGSHEGIRLWMLDCDELVAKHRARAERAEEKLAEIQRVHDRHWRALWVMVRQAGGSVFLAEDELAGVPLLASLGTALEPGGMRINAAEEA